MKNHSFTTVENQRYKIKVKINGIEESSDYQIYGHINSIGGCSKCVEALTIDHRDNNEFHLFVEPLISGTYQYQVFLKRVSSNVEFLILTGRIEVINRIGSENGLSPVQSEVEVSLNNEQPEISIQLVEGRDGKDGKDGKDGQQGIQGVQGERGERGPQGEQGVQGERGPQGIQGIQGEKGDKGEQGERGLQGQQGIQGERGEKGEKGDKGDKGEQGEVGPQGPQGEKGEKGEKGDSGTGGGSVDFILTNPNESYQGTPSITPNADGSTVNNLLIGDGSNVSGGGNTVIGLKAKVANANDGYTEGDSVAVGLLAYANGLKSVAVGTGAGTGASLSVAVGAAARVNQSCRCSVAIGQGSNVYNSDGTSIGNNSVNNGWGVTIGSGAWTSNDAVAIGNGANSDSYGLAIGNSAYADSGNITLKSGNVEVKFTPEGMTLNGEPYGGGSGSGGSAVDIMKVALKLDDYNTKYQNTNLYELRNQGSYWVTDKNGYSGDWQSYYNDLTPEGEWFYSLSMTDGKAAAYSFQECLWLKKFVAKIEEPKEDGSKYEYAFQNSNLEEFYTPSKIRKCISMFDGATKLEKFYADLSELRQGEGMFGYGSSSCSKLDLESVENIANSIGEYYGQIYLGIAYSLQFDYGDGNYTRCQEALSKIRNKGWTVYEIYSENY